jgi:hypothetical protein
MAFHLGCGKQPLTPLSHQMDEVCLRAMNSRDCFNDGTREHL